MPRASRRIVPFANEPMEGQVDGLATPQVDEIGGDHRGTPPAPNDPRKNLGFNALRRFRGLFHVRNPTLFFLQIQAPGLNRFREPPMNGQFHNGQVFAKRQKGG